MKKVLAITVLALFGFAPAIGAACELDATSASVASPAQLVLSPAPAATKVPASVIAKAPVAKTAKEVVGKVKTSTPHAKLAVSTN